jgi:hypothetical protein
LNAAVTGEIIGRARRPPLRKISRRTNYGDLHGPHNPNVNHVGRHTVARSSRPKKGDGFPPITNTEIALVAAAEASSATRGLSGVLAEFCSTLDPRKSRRKKNRK